MKVVPSVGIYTGYFRFGDDILDTSSYAGMIGKTPAIAHIFHDWVSGPLDATDISYNTFSSVIEMGATHTLLDVATTLAAQGTVLSVAWDFQTADPYDPAYYYGDKMVTMTADSVINGVHDSYIRTVANEIKGLGVPIMLSPFGEIDQKAAFAFGAEGTTYMEMVEDTSGQYGDPAIPDGPERMRDLYRHVVDIFNQEGVNNVTWYVYTSTEFMNADPALGVRTDLLRPEYLYPGDQYVDWIGQSVYFMDPQNPPVLSPTDVLTGLPIDKLFSLIEALSPGYNAWTSVSDKPFFIPEFGMVGDGVQDRAAMIADAFNNILPQMFPHVKALTMVDSQLAAEYFLVPRLGDMQSEIDALRQAVGQNSHYLGVVNLDSLPQDPFAGDDNLKGTPRNDHIESGGGNDTVNGRKGNDVIDGGSGNDFLYGSNGNDVLLGVLGNDYLDGGKGRDRLVGGAGDDIIKGGAGRDFLSGGDGYDVLYGGKDRDVFAFDFDLTDNIDIVKDFNVRQDALYLGNILEGTSFDATAGDQVSDFLSTLVYNNNTYLAVDVDGQGNSGKNYFAVLENVSTSDIETMISKNQVILVM